MRTITLLGAGRVGSAIARDLAPEFDVTVADVSAKSLDVLHDEAHLKLVQSDLRDASKLHELIRGADIVVGAVPGPLGFETVKRVLEAGRHIVDISFFEQDAFELDELARANGCVAIVDCGVAPGCSNLLLGRHAKELDRVVRFWCAVGGLPIVRTLPYEYKAPFSPIDVIAEYTRPARFRRGGRAVTMPALSEVELVEIPGLGTLEAFNTDGLRSLLRTVPVPDMVEKTMRYPGHADRMRMLRDSGFFNDDAIETTARLLFDAWQYLPGEADLTAMRVIVEGERAGERMRYTYDLLDRYDAATSTLSMARTTGYTCTAAVRLLASGRFARAGITPPELLADPVGNVDFIFDDLARHGVVYKRTEEEL